MKPYHKIQTVFQRDPNTKFKTVIDGQWSKAEFQYLQDTQWVITEKIEGTNIRIVWDPGAGFSFRGRTDNAQIPPFLLTKLQDITDTAREVFIRDFPDGVTLYGEGYGAKIQKGGGNYIPDGVNFILFDAMIGGWWLKGEDLPDVAEKLGIEHVPIVKIGTLPEAVEMAKAKPNSSFGSFPVEGYVMKPAVDLFNRKGERVITKIKCKDFE